MKLLSIYGPQNPEKDPPRRGYVVTGDDAFRISGYEMARAIDSERNGNSILFMPMESTITLPGSKDERSFGAPVEESLSSLAVPYRTLPIDVDKKRRRVIKPTKYEIAEHVNALRQRHGGGVTAVVYDDTVLQGIRVLTFYRFLKRYQNAFRDEFKLDDIKLAAFIDRRGITDYRVVYLAEKPVDKDEALRALMAPKRKLFSALLKSIDKTLAKVPETDEILKRVLLL